MNANETEKLIRVLEVSAFTKDGSGGNKAGVVFDVVESDAEKLRIAKTLGYSETVFVTAAKCDDGNWLECSCLSDYELRYFTPAGEVDLCGHATIGTFACLNELGLLTGSQFSIKTLAGILQVSVDDGLVMMEQKLPEFFESIEYTELMTCFKGLKGVEALRPQIVSTGLRDIILPVADECCLNGLMPDFEAIKRVSLKYDTVGIHAFALSDDVDAVCRNFAPLYGIDEESATGTSNCALSAYLYMNGIQKKHFVYEQGITMGQKSLIYCEVDADDCGFSSVSVGGYGKVLNELKLTVKLDSKEGK